MSYNDGTDGGAQAMPDNEPVSRITLTEHGLRHLFSNEPSPLSSMEAKVLVLLLPKPLSIYELWKLVQKSGAEYAFLEVSHVTKAVTRLQSRRYLRVELNATYSQPTKGSR